MSFSKRFYFRFVLLFQTVWLPLFVFSSFLFSDQSLSAQDKNFDWEIKVRKMVAEEIVGAGIKNKRVIQALQKTARHEFVSVKQRPYAYYDMALPIGSQQTISPPFIVAFMTESLNPQPTDRVLEIGTGSGYQAAILSPLVSHIYTIEIVKPLARRAASTLKRLKYKNISTRLGDGYLGWPAAAPFDKIIVTCSPEKVPQPLIDQLREGGLMVIPVGQRYQQSLYLFRKTNGKLTSETLEATFFVPMTGEAERRRHLLPNPLRPQISNGSFEMKSKKTTAAFTQHQTGSERDAIKPLPPSSTSENSLKKAPAAWHYLRQGTLVHDPKSSPDGNYYLQFSNSDPGRGCRALQAFPLDGRKVASVDLSFNVRAKKISYGQNPKQWPFVVVTYYDHKRLIIGEQTVGPFEGTFDWHPEKKRLPVPIKTTEAIIRIGLLGAVGEIAFDNFKIKANIK